MNIENYLDLTNLEQVMQQWADVTSLSVIVLDANGNAITNSIHSNDFYKKYMEIESNASKFEQTTNSNTNSVYSYGPGLINFNYDIVIDGTKLGSIVGGQVFETTPNDEDILSYFETTEETRNNYLNLAHKVPVCSKQAVQSAANLLLTIVNATILGNNNSTENNLELNALSEHITHISQLIQEINAKSLQLNKIESKQNILSLNASIEAARAGEFGRGFAVVAAEVGKLAINSGEINKSIKESLNELTSTIKELENLL